MSCGRGLVAATLLFAVALGLPWPAPAQPGNVLRVALGGAEAGFDPQAASDAPSDTVIRAIFEPLYRQDWVDGAWRAVPNTATAMPEISADGRTWTIRLRPGIHFTDHPAFGGRKRELVAADYVYSIKRLLDPRMRAPAIGAVDGLLEGADALVEKAKATGRFDYDAPLAGLAAVDRYTIRFRLNFPTSVLLTDLAGSPLSAVAREVVEAHGDGNGWTMDHPVGTGPFRLVEWQRGRRIVLERNPTHRARRNLDRIEISVVEEDNSRMLAFERGDIDYLHLPAALADKALQPDGQLRQALARRGVTLHRLVEPTIHYTFFNMDDPVVGGYAPEQVALRRAVAMAYDVEQDVRVARHGQAVVATQLIPPGVGGHDPKLRARAPYDPAAARALLDRFGYRDRDGDGWRERPDGSPLLLVLSSSTGAAARVRDELWQRSLKAVGLRTEFNKQTWQELRKAALLGKLQMMSLGFGPTPPEGIFFLDLLYGPFAGNINSSRFRRPEFDRLYERVRELPHGAERDALLRQASQIVANLAPFVLHIYPVRSTLVHPWVAGYRGLPFDADPWYMIDVDPIARERARKR